MPGIPQGDAAYASETCELSLGGMFRSPQRGTDTYPEGSEFLFGGVQRPVRRGVKSYPVRSGGLVRKEYAYLPYSPGVIGRGVHIPLERSEDTPGEVLPVQGGRYFGGRSKLIL